MDLLVLTTQPTSFAGVAALLAHVGLPEFLEEGGSETLLSTYVHERKGDEGRQVALGFPIRLASTVRAMAGTATVRRIEPSEPDPIYAAIKAEREAHAGYLAAGEVQTRMTKQNPFPSPRGEVFDRRKNAKRLAHPAHKAWWAEYKKAEDAHTASAQELWSAREAFLQTRPTTVAGLRAFVDHIEGPFSHGSASEAFWDEREMELAVPTLTAAVRNLVVRS